jgi:hypothetical protein
MEVSFEGRIYKLRAGPAMPTMVRGAFVLHTFMAEKNVVDMIACTDELPKSEEFRGQGGELISANYTRLNVKGGEIFSGKKVYAPEYIDEDDIDV